VTTIQFARAAGARVPDTRSAKQFPDGFATGARLLQRPSEAHMTWSEATVAAVVGAVAVLAVIGLRASRANPLGSMSDQWMAGYQWIRVE
jgi:hypothetical protein